MIIRSLRPYHFRNLSDRSLTFAPGVNIIVGKNAQGKTNLVEAIHLLSLSKSFRTNDAETLVRWGEESASVFGVVERVQGEVELGVSLESKGRSFYINGEKVKGVAEFHGQLVCVAFSPADLMLLQGGPSGRRKFLDKHLADLSPGYLSTLLTYNRALQNKNKLLKEGIEDLSLLDPWNEILAREALRINSARREFVSALKEHSQRIHAGFSKDDAPLSITLKSTIRAETTTHAELLSEYHSYRKREAAFRSSLFGPHRDDVAVVLGERDAREFASQGQSRSIVLSLTLGVIELLEQRRGDSPIVLLDDLNSELDKDRSDAFFQLVRTQGRQLFVTGTDASVGHLTHGLGYAVHVMGEGSLQLTAH